MISNKIKRIVMSVTGSMMILSTIAVTVQGKEINQTYLKVQSTAIKKEKTKDNAKVWYNIDEILGKCIDKLEEYIEYQGYIDEDDELSDDMGKLIAFYEVVDGHIQIKTVEEGQKELSKDDMKKHQIMWERVRQIIPKAYLSRINTYKVVTDGKDEIMAYVNADDSNKMWTMALDIEDAFDEKDKVLDKELNETIVHEFGHILTLNHEQIEPEYKEKNGTYATEEGTTKKDAYLNRLYQKFWSNIYEDYKKIVQAENNEEDGDATLEFYDKYKNQFVSDYAATNPEEDIAECFRVFVLENKPSGKTIAEKKVLLFYDFPELVKIRQEIRDHLKLK